MQKRSFWYLYAALFAFAPTFVWAILAISDNYSFSANIEAPLKAAATASTLETSHRELGKALEVIESWKLTEGYTSAFWKDESENVGAWYRNLKDLYVSLSDDEVEVVYEQYDGEISLGEPVATRAKAKSLSLENQSVVMSRVGSVILKPCGAVRHPSGLSDFPYNTGMTCLFIGQCLAAILGIWCLTRYL